MNDYIYIYKDSLGRLNTATSMPFIASHTACRAVPRGLILKHFETVSDFIYDVNRIHSIAAEIVLKTTELNEIYND